MTPATSLQSWDAADFAAYFGQDDTVKLLAESSGRTDDDAAMVCRGDGGCVVAAKALAEMSMRRTHFSSLSQPHPMFSHILPTQFPLIAHQR